MGREIKRVALDFDHPIGKIWDGFLNPHYTECPHCKGTGSTTARLRLSDLASLLMLSGEDSLKGKNHPYFKDNWAFYNGDIVPSPDMAELTTALAGRAPRGFGHDSIDKWAAEKKIIETAGLDPEVWGICPHCKGDGIDAAVQADYEAWKPTEPPSGEGWQVWENVTEGSPVSPVFATSEALVKWLVSQGYTEENASAFVKNGFVFPMIASSKGIEMGIDGAETTWSKDEN